MDKAQIAILLAANSSNEMAKKDVEQRNKEMEERILEYEQQLDDLSIQDEESKEWIEVVPPPEIKRRVK